MFFKKSPKSRFQKHYDIAHSRKHPLVRLAAAEEALQQLDALSPWPFEASLSRRRAEGKLHCVIGLMHMMLAEISPADHAELAWASCERALNFLTSSDGNAYALALMNAGIANADRLQGDIGQNVEVAIGHTKKALEQMKSGAPVSDLARCHGNLSSLYSERQFGDRVENIELAIHHGTKLVELTDRSGNPVMKAGAIAELGKFHQQRLTGNPKDNYSKSIDLLEQALKVGGAQIPPPSKAMILMDLLTAVIKHEGDGSDRMQRRVDELSDQALSLLSPSQTPEQWGVLQMRLAGILLDRQTGDIHENRSQAMVHIEEALNVLDEVNYPEHRKHALYLKTGARATSHEVGGGKEEVANAIEQARVALQHEDPTKSPRNWMRSALSLAELLSTGGADDRAERIEEAVALAEEVKSLVHFEEDPSVWIQAVELLGNCYAMRPNGELDENIEQSIIYLESALEKLDSGHAPQQWISVSLNLANSYEDRLTGSEADNLESAIARYEATLVVATETRFPRIRQSILKGLSRCWERRIRGDRKTNLNEARSALQSAQRLAREIGDDSSAALLENDILMNRSQIRNLADSTAVEENINDDQEQSSNERFLGELDDRSSQIDRDKNLLGWVESRITLGDFLTRAAPAGSVGDGKFLDEMASQCDKAISVYEDAQEKVDRTGFPMLWARLRDRVAIASGLMAVLADWRNAGFASKDEAPQHLINRGKALADRALRIRRVALLDGLEVYKRESMPRRHLEKAIELGKVEVDLKNWQLAHQSFESASLAANALLADVEVNTLEEQKILSSLADLASLAPMAAIKSGNVDQAIQIAESSRARLLSKSLTLDALPFSDSENATLLELRDKIREQEDRLNSQVLFNRGAPVRQLISLRDEMRALVMSKGFSGEVNVDEVNSALEISLEDDAVLVFPFLTEHGGEIAIAFKENDSVRLETATIDENGHLNRLFKLGVRDGRPSWTQSYAHFAGEKTSRFHREKWKRTVQSFSNDIGDIFAAPLASLLTEHGKGDCASLQFLSQGFLGHLPIGAAKISDTETLTDRFAIAQLPSLRVKSMSHKSASPRNSIVTVAPKFDDHGKSLPNAQLEAVIARSHYAYARELSTDTSDTLQTALSSLDGADIWHFCTHAVFDRQQPNKSYLDLGNDLKITAEEVLSADIDSPPELVILSACESGLYGLSELHSEFIGLPSAFIQAGARGVLATLWPALDVPSSLMLSMFHEEYSRGEISAAQSLQRAQVWLKKSTRYELFEKLQYWASDGDLDLNLFPETVGALKASPANDCIYADAMVWSGLVYFGSERAN